jgi:lysophospholipase L1-like esterase
MNIRLLSSLPVVVLALASLAGAPPASQPGEDARPVVPDAPRGPERAANPALPTLWLIGDSTMNSNGTNPQSGRALRGWASEIAPYFDTTKINVVNRAIGGRSSKTFMLEGRWEKVMSELKRGDFVIIQFGHNDAGKFDDPAAKFRPSLKGEGDETQELTKPDGTKETVHSFGWYMREYAVEAHNKGATVILASMVPHKTFQKRGERDSFVAWTRSSAEKTGSLFIDINETIAEAYAAVGAAKVEDYFADKGTHTTVEGAQLSAKTVVQTLKGLPADPLDPFLSERGKALEAVVPHPTPAP